MICLATSHECLDKYRNVTGTFRTLLIVQCMQAVAEDTSPIWLEDLSLIYSLPTLSCICSFTTSLLYIFRADVVVKRQRKPGCISTKSMAVKAKRTGGITMHCDDKYFGFS